MSVCLQGGRPRFDPWSRKIPWRRKWQPTPVLLPGKFHGWRCPVGYTVHGVAKSQTWLSYFTFTFKTFFYSSWVYSCQLFSISSASVRSLPFLSFIVPVVAWYEHLVSLIFLKRSLVLAILLFSSICLHCSLKKAFLSLPFSATMHSNEYICLFLSHLLLLFFSQLLVKLSQTTTLPSCISFSLEWFWSLPPVQCYKPLSIVHQALCLPDLESIRHLHCTIIWDLI